MRLPFAVTPVDLEVGAADHHVEVDRRLVEAARGLLRARAAEAAGRTRCARRRSRRAACCSRCARSGRCATSRRRARPRRAGGRCRSGRCRCTPATKSRSASAVGLEPDELAAAELAAQALRSAGRGTRAGTCTGTSPRSPAASGLVNVSSVGMFGAIGAPSGVASRPPSQRVAGDEARGRARCRGRAARAASGRACVSFAPRRAIARACFSQPVAPVPVLVGEPAEPEQVAARAGASPSSVDSSG